AADRDGPAEVVTCHAVRSGQFRLLAPRSAAFDEHVSRSLILIRADRVLPGPHQRRAAVYRDRGAEHAPTVGRGQLRLLSPPSAAFDKYIRLFPPRRAHHHRAAADRDGRAEELIYHAVGRGQLRLLSPPSAAFD